MNLFKFKINSQKTNKGEYFNMKKFILPVVITGAIVLKVYGLKKYLARKNNMSNAELQLLDIIASYFYKKRGDQL